MPDIINLVSGAARTAVTIRSLSDVLKTLRAHLEGARKMEKGEVFLFKGVGEIDALDEDEVTIEMACKTAQDPNSKEVVRTLTIQPKAKPVVAPNTVITIAKGKANEWQPYPIAETELQTSTLSAFRATLKAVDLMTEEDDFVVKDTPLRRSIEVTFTIKDALDKDQHLNIASPANLNPWG